MKIAVGAGVCAVLGVLAAAQAAGGDPVAPAAPPSIEAPAAVPPAAPAGPPVWDAWREPLQPAGSGPSARQAPPPGADVDEEIDVVDAHWMALTMWGEARSGGAAAMRAVGHVIDNRRRAGRHGRYVTDTVSAAWQFSCWNAGDPNLRAIRNIDLLRVGSEDQLMWLAAKRIAAEIMSERSADPTGGALFYHSKAVAPAWSRGVAPTRLIGGHLFFRTAR